MEEEWDWDESPARSYAWALPRYTAFADSQPRTWEEQRGLVWARMLAEDEQLRRDAGVAAQWRRLTPFHIAQLDVPDLGEDDLTVEQVEQAIAAARRRLFGYLTLAGIRARARRAEQRRERPFQRCRECNRLLPKRAPKHRKYCDEHRTVKARVKRHRAA